MLSFFFKSIERKMRRFLFLVVGADVAAVLTLGTANDVGDDDAAAVGDDDAAAVGDDDAAAVGDDDAAAVGD